MIEQKQFPFIRKIELIDHNNGIEPWIIIDFTNYVEQEKIDQITSLSSQLYQEISSINKMFLIKVPVGEEFELGRFLKYSIVKNASVNSRSVVLF